MTIHSSSSGSPPVSPSTLQENHPVGDYGILDHVSCLSHFYYLLSYPLCVPLISTERLVSTLEAKPSWYIRQIPEQLGNLFPDQLGTDAHDGGTAPLVRWPRKQKDAAPRREGLLNRRRRR